ncbi:N-acetyltransferase [candidate division WS5 bacterium]|uniref:N-acetyltransferase n=1 Tax=candidate division WS5 bacterium TaxID=2093353 RepID=A0A419DGV5_9BACT|nr:MAG: N-acetyltransferase [candidate division WS5 bacterium]
MNKNFKIEDIKIREAGVSDFSGIEEILFDIATMHHQGAPYIFKKPKKNDPAIRKDFMNIIKDKNNGYFVAILANQVVGLVSVSIKERRRTEHIVPGNFAYITELGVKKDFRGHGIGRNLMDVALDWIKNQKGILEVVLNVRSFNEDAIKLYQSLGFEIVSYRMSKRTENE